MQTSSASPAAMVLGKPVFDDSAPSLRVRGRTNDRAGREFRRTCGLSELKFTLRRDHKCLWVVGIGCEERVERGSTVAVVSPGPRKGPLALDFFRVPPELFGTHQVQTRLACFVFESGLSRG